MSTIWSRRRLVVPVAVAIAGAAGAAVLVAPVQARPNEGLTPGQYDVVIDLPDELEVVFDTDGSNDGTVRVTVEDGQTARADAAVNETSGLQGRVYSETTGRPLPAATVTCTWAGEDGVVGTADDAVYTTMAGTDGVVGTADDAVYTTTAGTDGSFLLVGAPTGTYSCSGVDPESGETSSTVSATVTKNTIASVDLPVVITSEDASSSVTPSAGSESAPVLQGQSLPATGRTSTTIVYAAWLLSLLGAGLYLAARRRGLGEV